MVKNPSANAGDPSSTSGWRRSPGVVVVRSLSRVCLTATPWTPARRASLSFTISGSLFKLLSIDCVMPWNRLILCLSLLPLPSIFPIVRVFSSESALPGGQKYWSFRFSISPSNEYSGLIYFRIDWFDFSAVQRTLKSSPAPQFESISSSHSAFLKVQLPHPYMTTGKSIALTRWMFFGKVRVLLFNTLSRLVIAFLLRSKCLLISWLQSLSTVILEPRKIKSVTVSIFSPSICHEVMGLDAIILVFLMV